MSKCDTCLGGGSIACLDGDGIERSTAECPDCKGSGVYPLCICLNCCFRNSESVCTNPKITENDNRQRMQLGPKLIGAGGDRLIYEFCEDASFYVEDNFGCVHFEQKGGL